MYAAKRESLEVVCYTDALEAETSPHLSLVSELRHAIDAPGQIVLYYQPKVDLASAEVNSVEALVRWQHPTRGLLGPDQFIPVAEATGVIRGLTLHVLRLALTQNREWAEHGVLLASR